MRKLFSVLNVLIFSIVLVACGSDEGSDDELVVYSPNSEDIINTIIPMFEKETGIKVELISAGTGELIKRIESEKDNPYARSEEHTSELQSRGHLVCRLLL